MKALHRTDFRALQGFFYCLIQLVGHQADWFVNTRKVIALH